MMTDEEKQKQARAFMTRFSRPGWKQFDDFEAWLDAYGGELEPEEMTQAIWLMRQLTLR